MDVIKNEVENNVGENIALLFRQNHLTNNGPSNNNNNNNNQYNHDYGTTIMDDNNNNNMDGNLVQTTLRALLSSAFIYGIADFRSLMQAHRDEVIGDIDTIQSFLNPPCSEYVIITVILDNIPLLEKYITKEKLDIYIDVMKEFQTGTSFHRSITKNDNHNNNRQQRRRRSSIINNKTMQNMNRRALCVFDDKNSENELVYTIGVDSINRTIYVVFRGTVTLKDFLVDFLATMHMETNLLANSESTTIPQLKNIGMHNGFYSYLFGYNDKNDGQTKSKYDQVLKYVIDHLDSFPGYTVTVTGHSMGGALASICAYYMSLDDRITKPVSCFTFASPRVGNISFVRSFQELELRKSLICVRIANEYDGVTKVPDNLTILTFALQDYIYRHVGVELILRKVTGQEDDNPIQRFRHVHVWHSRYTQFVCDFFSALKHTIRYFITIPFIIIKGIALLEHDFSEYIVRLEHAEKILDGVTVNDVYNKDHYR